MHQCHMTSLTAGGSGRLVRIHSKDPLGHFLLAVFGEQLIRFLILVFLYPALCYFHQLPTKYLSRHVHLNGVHLSYLEPLASRLPLSHDIKPNSGNITFKALSVELVRSAFCFCFSFSKFPKSNSAFKIIGVNSTSLVQI